MLRPFDYAQGAKLSTPHRTTWFFASSKRNKSLAKTMKPPKARQRDTTIKYRRKILRLLQKNPRDWESQGIFVFTVCYFIYLFAMVRLYLLLILYHLSVDYKS